MINQTNRFLRTNWGKLMALTLIYGVLCLQYGCMAYKQVPITQEELHNNKQVADNLDHYTIYVHDNTNTYKLLNPKTFNKDVITGDLEVTYLQQPDSTWKRQQRMEYWKQHKYDIHLFTDKDMGLATASNAGIEAGYILKDKTIHTDMVKDIRITALDMKKIFSDTTLAIVLILGIVLVILLLIILLVTAANAGEASSDASSEQSSADSGDSGSGASSEGSNASSGSS